MQEIFNETYPILPLRNLVMFPKMVIPLFVGRNKSLQALEAAGGGGQILLVAQRITLRKILKHQIYTKLV